MLSLMDRVLKSYLWLSRCPPSHVNSTTGNNYFWIDMTMSISLKILNARHAICSWVSNLTLSSYSISVGLQLIYLCEWRNLQRQLWSNNMHVSCRYSYLHWLFCYLINCEPWLVLDSYFRVANLNHQEYIHHRIWRVRLWNLQWRHVVQWIHQRYHFWCYQSAHPGWRSNCFYR